MQEVLVKIFTNLPFVAALIIGSRDLPKTYRFIIVCALVLIGLVMLLA